MKNVAWCIKLGFVLFGVFKRHNTFSVIGGGGEGNGGWGGWFWIFSAIFYKVCLHVE